MGMGYCDRHVVKFDTETGCADCNAMRAEKEGKLVVRALPPDYKFTAFNVDKGRFSAELPRPSDKPTLVLETHCGQTLPYQFQDKWLGDLERVKEEAPKTTNKQPDERVVEKVWRTEYMAQYVTSHAEWPTYAEILAHEQARTTAEGSMVMPRLPEPEPQGIKPGEPVSIPMLRQSIRDRMELKEEMRRELGPVEEQDEPPNWIKFMRREAKRLVQTAEESTRLKLGPECTKLMQQAEEEERKTQLRSQAKPASFAANSHRFFFSGETLGDFHAGAADHNYIEKEAYRKLRRIEHEDREEAKRLVQERPSIFYGQYREHYFTVNDPKGHVVVCLRNRKGEDFKVAFTFAEHTAGSMVQFAGCTRGDIILFDLTCPQHFWSGMVGTDSDWWDMRERGDGDPEEEAPEEDGLDEDEEEDLDDDE